MCKSYPLTVFGGSWPGWRAAIHDGEAQAEAKRGAAGTMGVGLVVGASAARRHRTKACARNINSCNETLMKGLMARYIVHTPRDRGTMLKSKVWSRNWCCTFWQLSQKLSPHHAWEQQPDLAALAVFSSPPAAEPHQKGVQGIIPQRQVASPAT